VVSVSGRGSPRYRFLDHREVGRIELDVERAHCDRADRDVATIAMSINHFGPVPGAEAFVARMRPFAELGVDTVILMPIGPDPIGFVGRVDAEIVPRLADP
jgi:hypothetical protein